MIRKTDSLLISSLQVNESEKVSIFCDIESDWRLYEKAFHGLTFERYVSIRDLDNLNDGLESSHFYLEQVASKILLASKEAKTPK